MQSPLFGRRFSISTVDGQHGSDSGRHRAARGDHLEERARDLLAFDLAEQRLVGQAVEIEERLLVSVRRLAAVAAGPNSQPSARSWIPAAAAAMGASQ